MNLSGENGHQLYIPHGFAHGFMILNNYIFLSYKGDKYDNKDSKCSLRVDDPDLEMNWGIPFSEAIISEKDLNDSILFRSFSSRDK